MYNLYKHKSAQQTIESNNKKENKPNQKDKTSQLANKHNERVKSFLYKMVSSPIVHYNFQNSIINSREIYEKELERKYGKKNDFKFTQFITERERIEYVNRLKEENKYNLSSDSYVFDLSYKANLFKLNNKKKENFKEIVKNKEFDYRRNGKLDISQEHRSNNDGGANGNSAKQSLSFYYMNKNKSQIKKSDESNLKQSQIKEIRRKSRNVSKEKKTMCSNENSNSNSDFSCEVEGKQQKNMKSFTFRRDFYNKYGKNNKTHKENKDKAKYETIQSTTSTYFKSLMKNTLLNEEREWNKNKNKLKYDKENGLVYRNVKYKCNNHKDKNKDEEEDGNKYKFSDYNQENTRNLRKNRNKDMMKYINKDANSLYETYPLLFSKNKFSYDDNVNVNVTKNEDECLLKEKDLLGKVKELAFRKEDKQRITLKEHLELVQKEKSKYKKGVSQIKEDDFKIIINGKMYDKRNISEISEVILKICNMKK